jgi:hypothetical protein
LAELLSVGEFSRLIQESLKAGTVCDNLLIFLLRGNLNNTVVVLGEFGLLGGKFKDEADGVKAVLDSSGFVFET